MWPVNSIDEIGKIGLKFNFIFVGRSNFNIWKTENSLTTLPRKRSRHQLRVSARMHSRRIQIFGEREFHLVSIRLLELCAFFRERPRSKTFRPVENASTIDLSVFFKRQEIIRYRTEKAYQFQTLLGKFELPIRTTRGGTIIVIFYF